MSAVNVLAKSCICNDGLCGPCNEARAAVANALVAAKELADAVDAETTYLESHKFTTIAEADEAKEFENKVVEKSQALHAALNRIGSEK